jgi:hypothetical protein
MTVSISNSGVGASLSKRAASSDTILVILSSSNIIEVRAFVTESSRLRVEAVHVRGGGPEHRAKMDGMGLIGRIDKRVHSRLVTSTIDTNVLGGQQIVDVGKVGCDLVPVGGAHGSKPFNIGGSARVLNQVVLGILGSSDRVVDGSVRNGLLTRRASVELNGEISRKDGEVLFMRSNNFERDQVTGEQFAGTFNWDSSNVKGHKVLSGRVEFESFRENQFSRLESSRVDGSEVFQGWEGTFHNSSLVLGSFSVFVGNGEHWGVPFSFERSVPFEHVFDFFPFVVDLPTQHEGFSSIVSI